MRPIRPFGKDIVPKRRRSSEMKLFGVERAPGRTKKMKSIRLFGKDIMPNRRTSAIKKTRRPSTASPPGPLPFALLQTAEGMGGRDWVFVTRKIFERSDVNVRLSRFFIPKNGVLLGVLSEQERRAAEGGGGVDVEVVDTRGGKYSMSLKKWPSLNMIVLNRGWRKLVEDNGLRAEADSVELWTFRADSKLCFALNIKSEGEYH